MRFEQGAPLSFSHPWLLLVALPLGLLLYYLYQRRRWRFGSLVLRLLTLVAAVAAVASLQWPHPAATQRRLYLLDVSGSCRKALEAQLPRLNAQIRQIGGSAETAVAVFSDTVRLWRGWGELPSELPESIPDWNENDSALQQALEWAAAEAAGHEVVVLTDCNTPALDTGRLRDVLERADCTVTLLPVWVEERDARVEEVRLPASLNAAGAAQGAVVFTGTAGEYGYQLLCDGREFLRGTAVLSGNAPLELKFDTPFLAEGAHAIEALLTGADGFPQNNRAHAAVVVRGAARVLVLAMDASRSAWQLMKSDAQRAVDFAMPAEVSVEALSAYETVVLDDVGYSDMSAELRKALPEFVKNGGGLVMMGRERSFGYGGYAGSEVEEVLPVRCSPAELETAAAIVVLDRSASMGETAGGSQLRKIDFAFDALERGVLPYLDFKRGDRMGLMLFNEGVIGIIALTDTNPAGMLAGARLNAEPQGRTELYSPVRAALERLKETKAHHKKMILLTDGRSTIEQATTDDFRALGEACMKAQVRIAVFSPQRNDERPELRALLLEDAPGVFAAGSYHEVDYDTLNDVFAREARELKALHRDGEFAVTVAASRAPWAQLAPPKVESYMRTAAREEAEVLLKMENGEPLAAAIKAGLGRSAVLCTQIGGSLARWEQVPALLNALLAETAAQFSREPWHCATRREGVQLQFEVDGGIEAAAQDRRLELRIALPSDNVVVILTQTALGRYEGAVNAPPQGVYLAALVEGEQALRQFAVAVPYAREWTQVGLGEEQLRQLSQLERLTVARSMAEIKAPEARRVVRYEDWSHWCWLAALLAFLADVLWGAWLGRRG